MCSKACTRVLFLQFKRLSENLSDGLTNGETVTVVSLCYGYDYTGNLIHRELADGEVQNYFYDLHDQLVKVEVFKKDGSKETWVYCYDALGRRIGKGRLKHEEVSDGLEKETGFVWDGSHLLQEIHPDGRYTYIYTDPDSYEPLAQVHNRTNEEGESRQQTLYFHCDQIGIPREMTDKDGNLLWFGDYYGWSKLKSETNISGTAHQPFCLQNQYCDRETGLHYNFFRYYEPDAGRFVNQDPIGLMGGANLYAFASNVQGWVDPVGLFGFTGVVPNPGGFGSSIGALPGNSGTTTPSHAATAVIASRGHRNTAAGVCSKPESEKTDPCYCPPGTCGIVYLRTHPKTGEKYVGQAKSPIRYFARQREHNRAFRATHRFTLLGQTKSGQCLDRLEEDHIRLQGGIKSRGGPLANKRHQMSEPRYRAAGGKIPMPY